MGVTILKNVRAPAAPKVPLFQDSGLAKSWELPLTNFAQGWDRGNRSTFFQISRRRGIGDLDFLREVAKCANPTFYRVRALLIGKPYMLNFLEFLEFRDLAEFMFPAPRNQPKMSGFNKWNLDF